ncbi:protein phosphatase 2C [Histomonas meleagridis]|nr:protein phosphatase 2C [Histomonas meleagridis]
MFPNLQILDVDETGIIYSIDDIPEVRELMTNQNELFTKSIVKVINSNFGVGFSEMCGIRDNMEDSIVVRNNIKDDISTYAVFDGHGGCRTSYFAAFRYVKIVAQYGAFTSNFVSKCISRINELIQKRNYKDGSTLALVLKKKNKIITAHLGDARILIIKDDGVVRFQTVDHKPEVRAEFERIRDAGSTVVSGRTKGILGVSRSIGDFAVDGISSEPVIQEIDLEDDDKWILIACDGVFDVVTNEMIKEIAVVSENANKFALNIRNNAYAAHSTDNISVIAVDVKYKEDIEQNQRKNEEQIWMESNESEFKGESVYLENESIEFKQKIGVKEEKLRDYDSQESFTLKEIEDEKKQNENEKFDEIDLGINPQSSEEKKEENKNINENDLEEKTEIENDENIEIICENNEISHFDNEINNENNELNSEQNEISHLESETSNGSNELNNEKNEIINENAESPCTSNEGNNVNNEQNGKTDEESVIINKNYMDSKPNEEKEISNESNDTNEVNAVTTKEPNEKVTEESIIINENGNYSDNETNEENEVNNEVKTLITNEATDGTTEEVSSS